MMLKAAAHCAERITEISSDRCTQLQQNTSTIPTLAIVRLVSVTFGGLKGSWRKRTLDTFGELAHDKGLLLRNEDLAGHRYPHPNFASVFKFTNDFEKVVL
jgi:hypothetical protein